MPHVTCATHTRARRWAAESIGPLPPAHLTAHTMSRKTRHLQRLERKCAALAAMAQRRLDASAAIRQVRALVYGMFMYSSIK